MPFTGKTGWGAFSSHCPKDGNIIILFAPHVGIDKHGVVGMVAREGQDQSSSACGAAKYGLQTALKDPEHCKKPTEIYDHQMDCIKHFLLPHANKIHNSENEQVALAYKMYDIIEEYLKNVVTKDWMKSPKSKLAIVGGIMINCDEDKSDRFLPLRFEVQTQNSSVDLFEAAFGPRPKNKFFKAL